MKYRFSIVELEEFTEFLSEAMEWVENIVTQVVRPEDAFYQSHMLLKSRSLFWGLMDMAMLICQAESLLRVLRCGRFLINLETVGLVEDIANACRAMICEIYQGINNIQDRKALEIELACSQEVQWLIDFLQQLLEEKPSRQLVIVPQPLVSRLPVIIKNSIVPLAHHSQHNTEKKKEDNLECSGEIINSGHEMVEVGSSTSVPDEKVDSLLSIIGELGTAANVFNKMSSSLMEHNLADLAREAKVGGQFIQRLAATMEEAVLSMRKVELGLIFLQFPRMVQEIGLQRGKNIHLTMEGGNTTVDKTLVRPLYHLLVAVIRRMATFSSEASADGEVVGNTLRGHIKLLAYSSGQQLMIEVEGDGQSMKGGDADAKALEISELMIGMNQVYDQMDAVPGHLAITNLPRGGSNIKITLPPLRMRCSGLLVEVSGELFFVPFDHVVEIVRVKTQQLVNKRGRQLLYHRGEVLGLLSLAETLGMMKSQREVDVTVLVVTNGQDKVGLIIHTAHDEQEIMVKSLPGYLKKSDYITGVALTRDGKVALVLNVSVLLNKN